MNRSMNNEQMINEHSSGGGWGIPGPPESPPQPHPAVLGALFCSTPDESSRERGLGAALSPAAAHGNRGIFVAGPAQRCPLSPLGPRGQRCPPPSPRDAPRRRVLGAPLRGGWRMLEGFGAFLGGGDWGGGC